MWNLKSLLRLSKGEVTEDEVKNLPLVVEKTQRVSRARLLPKLMRVAGKIPFADDLAASWYCAQDPDTPLKVKLVLLAALGYFVIPTDLLPDVIMGLGFTDDATVLATALSIVGGQIQPQHRRAARRLLGLPEPSIQTDIQS
ncbi:MAG: hypothetical protein CMK09_01610 [Ponticaulis sp.]|nr:hypothetical protein [Ponticaulis sp.]|tara:strand:+ start:1814 stop:2239 length:426 start_codon:yes stop_codon:yes gene_type:complete